MLLSMNRDLEYNKSLYFYGVGNNESISHSFPIKNLFQHPLVIFNVSLGAQAKGVFSVSDSIHFAPVQSMHF